MSLDIEGRPILKRISLAVHAGETLALVGESGSGKTLCCLAALGLLPRGSRLTEGKIEGLGQCWMNAKAAAGLTVAVPRGDRIAMVFQEPMTSLDPTMRCGQQITEVLQRHQGLTRGDAEARTLALFEEVQLPEPVRAMRAHPHALSGGQKQRILIAMALANDPDILLADEPTTALDSTLRTELLSLLRTLQQKRGLAMVLVTHDMDVVQRCADQVAVLYRGEVVENGPASEVLAAPKHRYTQGLLACRVPSTGKPSPLPVLSDFLGEDVARETTGQIRPAPDLHGSPLLDIEQASKTYPGASRAALDGVSLQLPEGGSLGIVGGSGCGKTTLARAILGLHALDAGRIELAGRMVQDGSPSSIAHIRSHVGLVFQDPRAALNPALGIDRMLTEVLCRWGTPKNRAEGEAEELLEAVGLDRSAMGKRPDAFSGGQRQRIVIARALAAKPKLLLCDEAVAALDVSIQAQVLNLLVELQAKRNLSLLFISHDLAVVRYLCDRTLVMDAGRVVEEGPSDKIWSTPHHPVTRRLQAAGGSGIS